MTVSATRRNGPTTRNSTTDPCARPLCVDLDGTLVRTDLLVEAVFTLLKRNPLYLFLLPFWLFEGRARFKRRIADRVDIDPDLLPYHASLLDHLREERARGRRLVLVTAADERFAGSVARYLGIFDEVLASTSGTNLSGTRKLERLQARFGETGFDYAGNAMADLVLWRHAGRAVLVNPGYGVRAAAERQGRVRRVFDDREGRPLTRYLKAIRLHQWTKNLLVFVPLVMAHRLDEPILLGQALLAFLAFGFCASSVYLLNDLLDLPDDRRHSGKCQRPIAAGDIAIIHAVVLMPVLLVVAFGISLLLPIQFTGLLALYYALTLAYSLRLKRIALVDVLTLAGLYTIRIVAGAAAVLLVPSFWLLAFAMFLFLSLALVKRFTELLAQHHHESASESGRGYRATDLETLSQFGTASAYMAVLVLALYINSSAVRTLYTHPAVIWLLCPLLLYMVMRIWLIARRDELHEDPVVFVIRDRCSQWLAAVGGLLMWLAA